MAILKKRSASAPKKAIKAKVDVKPVAGFVTDDPDVKNKLVEKGCVVTGMTKANGPKGIKKQYTFNCTAKEASAFLD